MVQGRTAVKCIEMPNPKGTHSKYVNPEIVTILLSDKIFETMHISHRPDR